MKRKGRQPKRQPKYPWQRMTPETSEEERDLILSLTEGLQKSETIYELVGGLATWLGNLTKRERAKQAAMKSPIVAPTAQEFAAVQQAAARPSLIEVAR